MDVTFGWPRRIWRIIYPPAIFFGIQIVVSAIAGIAAGVAFALDNPVGGGMMQSAEVIAEESMRFMLEHSNLILLISNIAGLFVFIPVWLRGKKYVEPFRNSVPAAICVITAAAFASFNILQSLLFTLTDVMKYFPEYEELSSLIVSEHIVIQILSIGIAAPIVEELVFRGILMNRMKWLPDWLSLFIQAVIFGVAHMNLFQGAYAFVAGALLGCLYIKFRSIIYVILGHIAYNLTSVMLSEFMPESGGWLIIFISFYILPACVTLLLLHKKPADKDRGDAYAERIYM